MTFKGQEYTIKEAVKLIEKLYAVKLIEKLYAVKLIEKLYAVKLIEKLLVLIGWSTAIAS